MFEFYFSLMSVLSLMFVHGRFSLFLWTVRLGTLVVLGMARARVATGQGNGQRKKYSRSKSQGILF